MGKVTNYNLPFIGGLRFPNTDEVLAGQNFTKNGDSFNDEWHFNYGGKMLLITAPDTAVPQELRYRTFLQRVQQRPSL